MANILINQELINEKVGSLTVALLCTSRISINLWKKQISQWKDTPSCNNSVKEWSNCLNKTRLYGSESNYCSDFHYSINKMRKKVGEQVGMGPHKWVSLLILDRSVFDRNCNAHSWFSHSVSPGQKPEITNMFGGSHLSYGFSFLCVFSPFIAR